MKNIFLKIGALLALTLVLGGGVALAAGNNNVSVPSGETISTDFIRAGETVDVAGNVVGDVILAGANVSFTGNATGDILIAGGNVRVNGNSDGNVRVVGGSVTLSGNVGKNVTVAGGTVILDEGSVVSGNLYVAGGSVELRGKVQGSATAYSSQAILTGAVQGSADIRTTNNLIIRQDASVGGNLTYASSTDPGVGQGVVKGIVTKVPIQEFAKMNNNQANNAGNSWGLIIWQFLSLLIVAFVLTSFFHRQVKEMAAPIRKEEVWSRMAYGLVSALLNVFAIGIVFITIIGMPLALMILFTYVIFIIIALTILPILIGKLFNRQFKLYGDDDRHLIYDFVLGFILMRIIALVPVLGFFVLLLLFLFAFGRVTQYIYAALSANRKSA